MEKDLKTFVDAYNCLPPKLRTVVKKKITSTVFMVKNPMTFYNKKNGKEKITEFEWNGIEKVFSDYGIDARTGKMLL